MVEKDGQKGLKKGQIQETKGFIKQGMIPKDGIQEKISKKKMNLGSLMQKK